MKTEEREQVSFVLCAQCTDRYGSPDNEAAWTVQGGFPMCDGCTNNKQVIRFLKEQLDLSVQAGIDLQYERDRIQIRFVKLTNKLLTLANLELTVGNLPKRGGE